MRFTTKALSAAVAIALSATSAQAQFTFTGNTMGCFFGAFNGTTSCTPTGSSSIGTTLSFAGSQLSQLAIDNQASFNNNVDNFGIFTLAAPSAGATSLAGNFFTLMINITNPASASGTTQATITGSVNSLSASSVFIDFGNNSFFNLTPASAGLQAQVNDLSVAVGSNNFANGRLQSVVPEPSTYALMATGLAGLVGMARRRRAVA